jgi:hypothetical protein
MRKFFILLGVWTLSSFAAASSDPATEAASWVHQLGLQVHNVTCDPWDSGDRPFVSCVVIAGDSQLIHVFCAAPGNHGLGGCASEPVSGCRSSL